MALALVTVPALRAHSGVVHGFEQRAPGTRAETREATRARVRSALRDQGRLFLMRQVHGTTVCRAPWDGCPEGDAALTTAPGVLVGVESADCLPVLLVDPVRGWVAAAHAGWRGTARGVTARAASALASRGSAAEDLLAALGPGIGPCCYEVGDELRAAYGSSGQGYFRPGPNGRPHLDVRAANRDQLLAAGLRPDRILSVEECTRCRADLYHSYRREGRGAGRMISFVGFAPGASPRPDALGPPGRP
jgi:hypothetical protein